MVGGLVVSVVVVVLLGLSGSSALRTQRQPQRHLTRRRSHRQPYPSSVTRAAPSARVPPRATLGQHRGCARDGVGARRVFGWLCIVFRRLGGELPQHQRLCPEHGVSRRRSDGELGASLWGCGERHVRLGDGLLLHLHGRRRRADAHVVDRANWLVPGNEHVYDSGSNTGVAPLTVDPGGHPLLSETLCDSNLFVTDSNGALTSTGLSPSTTEIKEVPTSLSGVTISWSAPGASVLTCDREGDIWALVENTAGTADELERFTDTGTLVTSFTLPTSVIAQGVAASPSSDELLVADNGQDQDFKWFNYAGTQTGQVGVTGGYLQGSDPGLVGPDRFVGPRSVAIDGSGNIYTAENCMPGIAQSVTAVSNGPCAIIIKYEPNGTTVVWRDVDANTFGGTGEPTADGSRFFDRDFEFTRDASGNYQPSPSRSIRGRTPQIPRVSSEQELGGTSTNDRNGATTYEWDADGHRYEGTFESDPMTYNIFEQQPNSEIMTPVYTFSPAYETLFMDSSGNMWGVVKGGKGGNNVVEYPLTGYSPSGTPEYGSAVSYGMPPGLVDVRGSTSRAMPSTCRASRPATLTTAPSGATGPRWA